MKITFDGITIEDASANEALSVIAKLRGSKVKSYTPGVYNINKNKGTIRPNAGKVRRDWTREELTFLIKNMDKKAEELVQEDIIKERGILAISAKLRILRAKNKKKMGNLALQLMTSFGLMGNDVVKNENRNIFLNENQNE